MQAVPTTSPEADPILVSPPADEAASPSLTAPSSLSVPARTADQAIAGASARGESTASESIGGSGPDREGMDSFQRLQRRMLLATVAAAALAVPITAWFFGSSAAFSLAVGSLAALLYLKLLARSVARLGVATQSMGRVQLLVPLLLVLAASRLPQLQILPALVGFLLYKPALILQALLDA